MPEVKWKECEDECPKCGCQNIHFPKRWDDYDSNGVSYNCYCNHCGKEFVVRYLLDYYRTEYED